MDMNQMTERLREALTLAQQEGIRRQQQQVESEHLLWALLAQEKGLAGGLLAKCGVSLEVARARVAEALDRLPKVTGAMEANKIYVAPSLNEVLVAAFDRAKQMGDEYVSVEHVLLAMVPRVKALRDLGLTENALLAALKEARGSPHLRTQIHRPILAGGCLRSSLRSDALCIHPLGKCLGRLDDRLDVVGCLLLIAPQEGLRQRGVESDLGQLPLDLGHHQLTLGGLGPLGQGFGPLLLLGLVAGLLVHLGQLQVLAVLRFEVLDLLGVLRVHLGDPLAEGLVDEVLLLLGEDGLLAGLLCLCVLDCFCHGLPSVMVRKQSATTYLSRVKLKTVMDWPGSYLKIDKDRNRNSTGAVATATLWPVISSC